MDLFKKSVVVRLIFLKGITNVTNFLNLVIIFVIFSDILIVLDSLNTVIM